MLLRPSPAVLTALRTRPLRILLVLATLLCAVAVATGSGATFRSSSAARVGAFSTGTLLQTNSQTGTSVLTATGLRPGSAPVTGTVTITNTGTLPATFSLRETNAANGFSSGTLTLEVTDVAAGTTLYRGDVGGLGTRNAVALAAGASRTFRFTATFSSTAPSTDQGRSARADFEWNAVPTASG